MSTLPLLESLVARISALELGGGADPWTYINLASSFLTSSTSNVTITGLQFTPVAGKTYEFEAFILVSSALTTTGPRPGVRIGTGGTLIGAANIDAPNTATAQTLRNATSTGGTVQTAAATGIAIADAPYLSRITGMCVAGAAPSGAVQVTLASEIAASTVTAVAGSFLRYREVG